VGQNWPNPFAGATAIEVRLPRAGRLSAAVYDVTGRRVATLADGERPAGTHTLRWDAGGVAPGVYVVRVEAAGEVRTRRAVVVR